MREQNFNELTPAETERLALLAEECGEVVQVVGKILRHGMESCNPFDNAETTNRRLLEKEIGQVFNAVDMLVDAHDVSLLAINEHHEKKSQTIGQWLHHQPHKESNE